MTRSKKTVTVVLFFCVLACAFLAADSLHAEFYKYVDKDGVLRFVDDPAKIPPEYRENTKAYQEKYDHLSEAEKQKRIEEEEATQVIPDRQAEELTVPVETRPVPEEQDVPQATGTPVTIKGNQILVPVTLGYNGYETETLLLLDTGANIIALHQDVADRLHVVHTKNARAYVAGGQTVSFRLFKLGYIQVGPHRMEDVNAGIIKHKGPSVAYHGLLGTNFLQNFKYSIDFAKREIRWSP